MRAGWQPAETPSWRPEKPYMNEPTSKQINYLASLIGASRGHHGSQSSRGRHGC
jgi:hypothetical protein